MTHIFKMHLKIGVSPLKWGSKLLISVILRHIISANIFGTKQTIHKQKSHSNAQGVPYIRSTFDELWAT